MQIFVTHVCFVTTLSLIQPPGLVTVLKLYLSCTRNIVNSGQLSTSHLHLFVSYTRLLMIVLT